MERLQVAMEKARAQRDQAGISPAPRQTAAPHGPQTGGADQAAQHRDAAWMALDEIRISNQNLQRSRITTVNTGPASAPFDLLRTRMLQQARQNGWKRIAIVSPHANCGKSTVAANLALGLARQSNLHSMVFDFDLRRSGLSKIIGQQIPSGSADLLERQVDPQAHLRRYGRNLAFSLSNGIKVQNPSEILQNPQTSAVLDEVSAQYDPDIMLFDMPPLMASDDNFGFLQNVDCVLIIAAAEQTSMTQIDLAERQAAELTNVMGIVLNKCRYTSGAHGHEYDYY